MLPKEKIANKMLTANGEVGGQGDETPGSLHRDGKVTRSDMALIRRASKSRWDVPEDMRKRIVSRVGSQIETANPRELMALANTVIRMDEYDLTADIDEDRRARLDGNLPTENVTLRAVFDSDYRHRAPDALPEAAGSHLDPSTNGRH